jgi:PilZ domain
VFDAACRCWVELRLSNKSLTCINTYVATFGHAEERIAAFCDDVAQWGTKEATFLHAATLATTWKRVSQCALRAINTLHPEIVSYLPHLHAENTTVLTRLLSQVLAGETPCLDRNGALFIPELPQRRPAPRRTLNLPCLIEHQGRTWRGIAKDVSTGGLGLERVAGLVTQKVALIEFPDSRCLAGTVVWIRGPAAGIRFDRALALDDPLLK